MHEIERGFSRSTTRSIWSSTASVVRATDANQPDCPVLRVSLQWVTRPLESWLWVGGQGPWWCLALGRSRRTPQFGSESRACGCDNGLRSTRLFRCRRSPVPSAEFSRQPSPACAVTKIATFIPFWRALLRGAAPGAELERCSDIAAKRNTPAMRVAPVDRRLFRRSLRVLQVSQPRDLLLNIAVWVKATVRRVALHLPPKEPAQAEWLAITGSPGGMGQPGPAA